MNDGTMILLAIIAANVTFFILLLLSRARYRRQAASLQEQLGGARADIGIAYDQIASLREEVARAHFDKRAAESELMAAKTVNRMVQVDAHAATARLHEAEIKVDQLLVRDRYISSAGDRIAHDVGQRLQDLRDSYLGIENDPKRRAKVERDFSTVLEKIRLHLADDIKTYVEGILSDPKKQRSQYPADGLRLNELLEEVAAATKYEQIVIEPSDVRMKGDWVHWELLFSHLMNNAVEAAKPSGGLIRIMTHVSEGRVNIDFDNEGSVISDEIIATIFDLGVSTKGTSGRGIGLFVARKIAEGLGGRIESPTNRQVSKGMLRRKIDVVRFTVMGLPVSDVTP